MSWRPLGLASMGRFQGDNAAPLGRLPWSQLCNQTISSRELPSTKSWERKYYKRQRVLFTWTVAQWLIESLGHEIRAFFLSVVWHWASGSACLGLSFRIYQAIAKIHILSEGAVKSKIRSFYGKVFFNSKNMPKLIKLMFSVT